MDAPTCGSGACLPRKTMVWLCGTTAFLLIVCWRTGSATIRNPYDTYDVLFRKGTEAYLEENWYDCISNLLDALDDYKFYRRTVSGCRSRCREDDDREFPLGEDPQKGLEDLDFYAKALRITLCIMKCKKTMFGGRSDVFVPKYVEEAFETKQPYDYLQLCYYKTGNIQLAASAAYTFLAFNPEHEIMKTNLKYYTEQPDIDRNKVKNLETQPFQELYLMGNEAYNKKKYEEVKHYFENALEEYYRAEEECRYLCEGPFDQNGFPEFILSLANHFTYTLKCKQRCPLKLSFMYGEQYEDYLPSHYHYLQFAYFKVGEIRSACEAVGSYLMFHPDDKTMNKNKEYFLTMDDISEDDFKPSQEVVNYIRRDKYEKKLLKFIKDNYKFEKPATKKSLSYPSLSLSPPPSTEIEQKRRTKDKKNDAETELRLRMKRRAVDILRWSKEQGIVMTMGETELNGTRRFVADGFANYTDCEDLIQLAREAAVHGDGYNGKPSPHTEYESFEGLTVGRAAMLVKLGMMDIEKAQLFINLSEKGRDFVHKYFNLDKELYFSFTHLVCRTALAGSTPSRSDLSHPVHADNCVLTKEGCLKQRPAYTWRDYSAIMYLNEDFTGGEFIFAKNKDTVQSVVKPKCGRLVGFSAGEENLHGVRAVLEGRRCALAMWYTLDGNHSERERELAQQLLDQVRKDTQPPEQETIKIEPPPSSRVKKNTNTKSHKKEKSVASNTQSKSKLSQKNNDIQPSVTYQKDTESKRFAETPPATPKRDEESSKTSGIQSKNSKESNTTTSEEQEISNTHEIPKTDEVKDTSVPKDPVPKSSETFTKTAVKTSSTISDLSSSKPIHSKSQQEASKETLPEPTVIQAKDLKSTEQHSKCPIVDFNLPTIDESECLRPPSDIERNPAHVDKNKERDSQVSPKDMKENSHSEMPPSTKTAESQPLPVDTGGPPYSSNEITSEDTDKNIVDNDQSHAKDRLKTEVNTKTVHDEAMNKYDLEVHDGYAEEEKENSN